MSASPEPVLEPERVARALVGLGSVREAMALLRAAVARDAAEEGCSRLLARLVASAGAIEADLEPPALTLALVDRWIRSGMLVEALALLGGTAMGSDETGREWANLLGELLAPVPVDAEPALWEMHRQLVTGGASVALVLLEERARGEPPLPAWAERRLELLRWMLLDNAHAAEGAAPVAGSAPTPLAKAVQRAMAERGLRQLLEVARQFASDHPADPDPRALEEALQTILAELDQNAEEMSPRPRTLPTFGHPLACMQLRMGNFEQACAVYRKLLGRGPDDALARRMLQATESVLRAARGQPVRLDDPRGDGDTEMVRTPPLERTAMFPSALQMPRDVLGLEDEPTTAEPTDEDGAEAGSVLVRIIRRVE